MIEIIVCAVLMSGAGGIGDGLKNPARQIFTLYVRYCLFTHGFHQRRKLSALGCKNMRGEMGEMGFRGNPQSTEICALNGVLDVGGGKGRNIRFRNCINPGWHVKEGFTPSNGRYLAEPDFG